jgi:hypothetical protein
VGEELIGIPSLKTLIILNYLQKKEMVGKLKSLLMAVVLFKNLCKFRRTPTIDGCFRYVNYIWLKVLSLEQRNWQRIKEKTKQEQIAMAKLYLYQAVDIVTQKEKKALFLCGR